MKGLRRVFSSASCFRPEFDEDHGVVYMENPSRVNGTNKKQPMVNQVEMNHFGESSVPMGPSALDGMADKVRESLGAMGTLLSAMKAPLPTGTGDGSALPVEKDDSVASTLATIVKDVSHLGFNSVEKVAKMTIKTKSGEYVDDKEYLMEHLINAAASLPNDMVGQKLTNGFVATLWNDLEHPPKAFMSDKYQYRSADGSDNSYLHPRLGAAHEAYARTVKPTTVQPGNLPDPAVLFDVLMARDKPTEHPNKISSVLFYIASIIIHDLFKTNHKDFRISDTSSYLDLSPLYGSDQKEQDSVRTFKDGKIKPDSFAETRLLSFPPGVGVIMVMFNRFHNYIVEQLALINENSRFTRLAEDATKEKWDKYDNDLFQTGRLITCGLYINIILIDYVRTILNLNRTDSDWKLDPRVEFSGQPDLGCGNQVSAEFNLVYRWHSAVSDKDDKWTQDLFAKIFPGKTPDEVPQLEFLKTLGHMEADLRAQDPAKRNFHDIKRKDDGTLPDDELAQILIESIEDCANAFGPRQVPKVMRQIEVLGIRQARAWNLATLNEFRKHFSLKPYSTFEEITADKEISESLKHLYDHPDNVELYPGLVVEDAKFAMRPGSGLCPSYTTSRAVLSDATVLVRGDRFYTTSHHPSALTNWGFAEQGSDLKVNHGCVMYKLFMKAFPNHFRPDSVYVHFPFTVPSEMKKVLTGLGKADKYNFDRPTRLAPTKMLFSYPAAKKVLYDQEAFKVYWGSKIEFLMGPKAKSFMLAGDTKTNTASRDMMEQALYLGKFSRKEPTGNEKWLLEVRKFYEEHTAMLLQKHSYKLAGTNYVDLIRDVSNIVHVHFCSEVFNLPLKTEENPDGAFTEKQMYLVMAAVFACVFFDVDPEHSFALRQGAHGAIQAVGKLMEMQVQALAKLPHLSNAVDRIGEWWSGKDRSVLTQYGKHMIERLLHTSGMDVQELVWAQIIPTAGSMCANQGQFFGQVIDWLFSDGREYLPLLHELAVQDTPEAEEKIMRYFLEFSRLHCETGVYRTVAKEMIVEDMDRRVKLNVGDTVALNFRSASRDPEIFPDPETIKLDRPIDSYIHLGQGPHQCLGQPMTLVAMGAILKTLCKLPNLRPAPVWPGPVDSVKKVVKDFSALAPDVEFKPEWEYHCYLLEDWDQYFPFPASLKICWDGPDA
ncbi:hypothetical protein D6D12_00721 [Aureobasidium pullulans]|uniref:Heme peroxidase n=1 Tax=Aureobasidium pullulans TaxID=5580 RepID=A0AB74K8A9_AURPU|nr:hypothetical protein D6D12_00721 [Aureobasidium pullulans]THX53987.1 hypothetical protein D6D11_04298 [Aureobasidium pullulans]